MASHSTPQIRSQFSCVLHKGEIRETQMTTPNTITVECSDMLLAPKLTGLDVILDSILAVHIIRLQLCAKRVTFIFNALRYVKAFLPHK